VDYSRDGTDWTTLGDVSLAQATARATYTYNTTVDFGGVAARYVRLTVRSGWGSPGQQYGLSEVRFLYVPVRAREPQPADGATGVDPATMLSWRAGRDATVYDVYLGTGPQALILADTVDGTAFVPGDLQFGRTYYWMIDAIQPDDPNSVWSSAVWSFSTQEYALIDAFETYTDDVDAGEAIFDTWIDGWINDTGSTVGYLQTPFAEQAIVRSGRQSMPLFYDNTSVAVSEATRTFDEPQDWTRHGLKALTLWFYGDPSNTTGQMYVKVNGSKVLYGGAVDNLRLKPWQFWYIDLADFAGVDLRNVRELTIGVEGGNGLLFIDDIALSAFEHNSIVPVEPDSANLEGHFAFEGNANDSSGIGHGVLSGTPVFGPGRTGQAIQLNGLADYVHVERTYDLPTYSAALWFRVDGGTGERDMLSVYDSAGAHGILVELRGNGTIRFLHRAPLGTSGGTDIYSAVTADDGDWYHVAVVKTGQTTTLYINGEVAGTAEDSSAFGEVLQHMTIGVLKHDSLSRYFPGAIDEVYLYSRPLSRGEIAWLAGRTTSFDAP
jgi:hypothetical protein